MTVSAPRARWNQVKTARKGKTLAALEKAAMRFHRCWGQWYLDNIIDRQNPGLQLARACARHAASKKRKGTK